MPKLHQNSLTRFDRLRKELASSPKPPKSLKNARHGRLKTKSITLPVKAPKRLKSNPGSKSGIHSLKWFLARAGKRIYRLNGAGKECCNACDDAKVKGIAIALGQFFNLHCQTLYDVQFEMGYRYGDKK